MSGAARSGGGEPRRAFREAFRGATEEFSSAPGLVLLTAALLKEMAAKESFWSPYLQVRRPEGSFMEPGAAHRVASYASFMARILGAEHQR